MSGYTDEIPRPTRLVDYVGQDRLIQRLLVRIEAAKAQGRMLDHVFLEAAPGSGKTTLAKMIATALGDEFWSFKMPMNTKDFIYFCDKWDGGVLLLDEIHAANDQFQELLLTGIEDGYLQPATGVKIDVRHITFIAATTEPDEVIEPLLDRFRIKPRWETYTDEAMAEIILGMASRAGVDMPADVAQELSRAAGGTPRIAGALVTACRDLRATSREVNADAILDLTGFDIDGLSERHLDYLVTLDALGRQAGLTNICSLMRMKPAAVMKLERLLITRDFIRMDVKGRTMTLAGESKLPNRNRPTLDSRRRVA
jgi:Holliday junction DNA helicase RuvB